MTEILFLKCIRKYWACCFWTAINTVTNYGSWDCSRFGFTFCSVQICWWWISWCTKPICRKLIGLRWSTQRSPPRRSEILRSDHVTGLEQTYHSVNKNQRNLIFSQENNRDVLTSSVNNSIKPCRGSLL